MNGKRLIISLLLILLISSLFTAGASGGQHVTTSEVPMTRTSNYVVFQSCCLPSNLNFTIQINNKSYESSGYYLNISLPDGTYNYTIALPYDYTSNISSGHIILKQSNELIHFRVSYRSYNLGELVIVSVVLSLVSILVFIGYYIKITRK